ncbi:MAG: LPP20 family lipoprotein [bacterium]
MKKIIVIILNLLSFCTVYGQIENYRESDYYIGIAEGNTLDAARNNAMSNLIQKIQVFVSSNMERTLQENNTEFSDSTSIKTISNSFIILHDVDEIVENIGLNRFKVFKVIKKQIVREIFKQRIKIIKGYLDQAELELLSNKKTINIGIVLKNYYWAYLLSSVTPDTMTYTFKYDISKSPINTTSISATTLQAINYIIGNIIYKPVKKIESENITWKYQITFFNKLVEEFNYSYFDGIGEMLGDVKNGETILDFYFNNNNIKDNKEFSVTPEIAAEDQMDDLLKTIHNFYKAKILSLRIKCEIINDSELISKDENVSENKPTESTVEPIEIDTIKDDVTPNVISSLLTCSNYLDTFLIEMQNIEKKGAIVTGYARDFESLNNLYAVVVDNNNVVGLIKHINGKCFDYLNNQNSTLQDYAGKKILWFEILR